MSFIADTRDLERAQKILAGIPNGTQKAISSAINKSAGKAVTGVIQSLKNNYEISPKNIRKSAFNIRRAKVSSLEATITIKGKVLGLNNFKMTPIEPAKQIPSVKVKKGGGGKFPGAFVARMKSGHIGIFERFQDGSRGKIKKYMKKYHPRAKKRGSGMTKGRAAIKELYGPSIPRMVKSPEIRATIWRIVRNEFDLNMKKAISRILEGNMNTTGYYEGRFDYYRSIGRMN